MSTAAITSMMDETAWAVVDKLAKWDAKFDHVRSAQRAHQRKPCRLVMSARFADKAWKLISGDTRIWVRNISRGGLNFVHNEEIRAPHVRIRAEAAHGQTEMTGVIVSSREVHDGFYEYGVKFAANVPPAS